MNWYTPHLPLKEVPQGPTQSWQNSEGFFDKIAVLAIAVLNSQVITWL